MELTSDLVSHPYACVVEYNKPGSIALFQKQNYKVSLNVGIAINRIIPAMGILETGAGPHLVSSELLPPKWLARFKAIAHPGLTAATRLKVNVQGAILLHVKLGDL